ncbi:hypothetical protein KP509_12G017100 [Ceratopteris richardii]|uniref:Clu domain-containing protein n=1 Tax=Ceratopteris richardii TaxID=49495 RepID=A0A8T2TME1_CERRI|nr:hypothetical protein KP509_12G017100 [Ceratopteris richardii]
MAPRTGKAKAHKAKGEKKKKEEKTLPVILDIGVIIPNGHQITLKGITTDRILDVRRLLRVHTETCHLTNISFSHEVKGDKLRDTLEVAILKPCVLKVVEEEYAEEQAVSHIQRLLDIVACTTCFGPSGKLLTDASSTPGNSKDTHAADGSTSVDDTRRDGETSPDSEGPTMDVNEGRNSCKVHSKKSSLAEKPEAAAAMAAAKEATEKGDMTGMCPPSRLGSFYEFFSLSHLTPPIQILRRSVKQQLEDKSNGDYFAIDVKLCNGKWLTVMACSKGFYCIGKQLKPSHSLVSLFQRSSKSFADAYGELMKAFYERNKFGNLPFGFRANTWLVPPVAADSPSTFPPLPMEDENWGGNGGGLGRDNKADSRPWAEDIAVLAAMPCKTPEERQIRDRKAFLLHSLFVDVAVVNAVALIDRVGSQLVTVDTVSGSHEEVVGNLKICVRRDVSKASWKLPAKIDGSDHLGLLPDELAQRNLLKGITADESTTVHDTATLGLVIVRHKGFTAVVSPLGESPKRQPLPDDIHIDDQPEGGANALNVNSLRYLLQSCSGTGSQSSMVSETMKMAESTVAKVLQESLTDIEMEDSRKDVCIRWELGACWVQHLQSQISADKTDKKTSNGVNNGESHSAKGSGKANETPKSVKNSTSGDINEKVLPSAVESNTTQYQDSSNNKAMASSCSDCKLDTSMDMESIRVDEACHDNLELKRLLSESSFRHLKESETGLHKQSFSELLEGIQKYYEEVALPKLVADFGSLELSPVDGRTLTDFMHTRGLRMRSLGGVLKLAEKLPHVQSLCIHEMVIRAYKHLLRAVVSSVNSRHDLAAGIAAALNAMLGTHKEATDVSENVWKWLQTFINKRFGWKLTDDIRPDLRKFAVLRGLCHKVGIEVAPRDYDMECSQPFKEIDIISMVPVYKQVACSSADGRTLLESSKTALDKGKLDDAVNYGTKALAKLVAVCGPYHRMTAGAYSLLAVVLYHTGDFNQAAIYQQKALDINERELGLDHPDTMKSYGDLAVFYYRLQHTELALKYVNRALYLLHLTCGPSHPNTAATYINVAMMEEGLGNIHIALRYLHEALKCNQRLLGADHIQTAASYHAIAIALSLMEAYSLSVQHEQTTLQILQAKLGADDLRTQDAAAWLEYFESKALEQQEAARNGTPKPDASIASKGHLSVSDLLDFINANVEAEGKELETKKKTRRSKSKGKGNQSSWECPSPHGSSDIGKDNLIDVTLEEEESSLEPQKMNETSIASATPMDVTVHEVPVSQTLDKPLSQSIAEISSEHEDEGWQDATPRGRNSNALSRRAGNRRPGFAKITTQNASHSRYSQEQMQHRGGTANFGNNMNKRRTMNAQVHNARSSLKFVASNVNNFKKSTRISTANAQAPSQPASAVSDNADKPSQTLNDLTKTTNTESPLPESEKSGCREADTRSIQAQGVDVSLVSSKETSQTARVASLVPPSLLKAPSYKEVALAPPGNTPNTKPAVNKIQENEFQAKDVSVQPKTSADNTDRNGNGSALDDLKPHGDIAPIPSTVEKVDIEEQGSTLEVSLRTEECEMGSVNAVDSKEQDLKEESGLTESSGVTESGAEELSEDGKSADDSCNLVSSTDSSTRLSAAAAPYNPSQNTVAVTPMKEGKDSQTSGYLHCSSARSARSTTMALTPIRRPPRLSGYHALYYGPHPRRGASLTNYQLKAHEKSGNESGRTASQMNPNASVYIPGKSMNPNAAEFIPGKVWQPSQPVDLKTSESPECVKLGDDTCGNTEDSIPQIFPDGSSRHCNQRNNDNSSADESDKDMNTSDKSAKNGSEGSSSAQHLNSNSQKLWADLVSESDTDGDVPAACEGHNEPNNNSESLSDSQTANGRKTIHVVAVNSADRKDSVPISKEDEQQENGNVSGDNSDGSSHSGGFHSAPERSIHSNGDGFTLVTTRRQRVRSIPMRQGKGAVHSYYRRKGVNGNNTQVYKSIYRPITQRSENAIAGECLPSAQPQVVSVR